MPVHPVEYRYGTDEMKSIWSEEGKIKRMLEVEIALLKSLSHHGFLNVKDVNEVEEKIRNIDVERIREIESEIGHDIMALVKAITEVAGKAGRWVHFGATSNDIIDTATALQLKDSLKIIEKKLMELCGILADKARKYRTAICLGRTHGQPALPVTYGFRFAVWLSELMRYVDRLNEARPRITMGKVGGAVGTHAAYGDEGFSIEKRALEILGLEPAEAYTQIIPRDVYMEYVSFMAMLSTTLEKIATNVRILQRAEVGELEEEFGKKQVGSSTMPHKRNPVTAEQICGIARVVRGLVTPIFESSILWEERDLTNSSAERISLPEVTILTDHILTRTIRLLRGLRVNAENARKNLERMKGLNMAEAIMIELTKRGMGRQDAHELVRSCAMTAVEEDKNLLDVLLSNRDVINLISEEELKRIMNPENYLGTALERIDRIIEKFEELEKT